MYDDLVSTFVHTLITKRKIAQREKLYQEAVAKSDAGAQLLIDELRQYPKQTLQQSLKQSRVQSLLQEYAMKTDWEQDELLVTIPVQDAQQLQLRLQKQGSAVHIKAWKTITKGDAL